MKRIVATASLLAVGAASLHAIYAPELTRIETGKPWTVAASLRGFYDDNRNCAPDHSPAKQASWGFEARPYVGINLPMEQSYFGFSYLNSSRYYEHNYNAGGGDSWDFDNDFNLKFDHQFSPRYRLKLDDTFTYGVQPDIVGEVSTMPYYRSDLSFLRNRGVRAFTGELTEIFGFSLSYNNTWYDYLDDDQMANSYSARLDRWEHGIPVDFRWQARQDLVALIGYQYGRVNYTADGTIGGLPSDSRDAQSHAIYVGGDYDITAALRASLRVGAQYTLYSSYSSENQWTPYVDFSLSYYYTVGSHVDLGFKHIVSATDVYVPQDGVPTLDSEASVLYGLVSHQITPKMTGNLMVQYQLSDFHGGYYDSTHDNLLSLYLYLTYRLNPWISFEGGYNFSWLDSNVTDPTTGVDLRGYDRNYVYLGVRAQY